MKTNLRRRVLTCSAVILTACAALTASLLAESPFQTAAPTQSSAISAAAQTDGYIITTFDGKICVFSADNMKIPLISTDIDASLLRKTDYQLLQNGICVYTDSEVYMLLEDYGS